jgi:hypothetical protein
MTDQQRATICSRCGGLRDRCECAEIRRAAFAEAAAWCGGKLASCTPSDLSRAGAFWTASRHFGALARKPGAL